MINPNDMLLQFKNLEELLQYEKVLKNSTQVELNAEKFVHKKDNEMFMETIKNLTEKLSKAEEENRKLTLELEMLNNCMIA